MRSVNCPMPSPGVPAAAAGLQALAPAQGASSEQLRNCGEAGRSAPPPQRPYRGRAQVTGHKATEAGFGAGPLGPGQGLPAGDGLGVGEQGCLESVGPKVSQRGVALASTLCSSSHPPPPLSSFRSQEVALALTTSERRRFLQPLPQPPPAAHLFLSSPPLPPHCLSLTWCSDHFRVPLLPLAPPLFTASYSPPSPSLPLIHRRWP